MEKSCMPFMLCVFLVLSGCQLVNHAAPSGQVVTSQSTIPSTSSTATESEIVETSNSNDGKNNVDFSQDLQMVTVSGLYQFAEGPVESPDGSVFFSDINAGKIYKWSTDGSVNVYFQGLNMPNGLALDASGNLIVCEGGNGRVISIDSTGSVSVVADQYNGIRFNEPNDLWIDPWGGIYFTDPAFNSPVVQQGENVYYISPDRGQIIRVIDNLVKPNGIEGTSDGLKLFVADWGANLTYSYNINSDGSLSDRRLIVASGSDGLTLDAAGNLYLTVPNQVNIYDPSGKLLREIHITENPTNLTFAVLNDLTLFITARTAVYTVQFSASEVAYSNNSFQSSNLSAFILTSPDIMEGGVLPVEYTCDGTNSTLALTWSGAPEGTKSFAVIMHHVASPTDIHWYWVVYDIPAYVTSLAKNSHDVGILGTNSVNDRLEYAPPCSKGPGPKTYIFTVYALSAQPQITVPASQVNRAVLLNAIKDITIASAEMEVIYSRP